ncbi:hypothetical protein GJ496_010497 [Pomphorhynchus laevis]|nr:hypothetical protein GJ496_010497 [Pomphorhynchus laevis]
MPRPVAPSTGHDARENSHIRHSRQPISASSQRRLPANKQNGQNCKSDSNTKSQNAPSPAGEASPRLRELIKQKRFQIRQKADITLINGVKCEYQSALDLNKPNRSTRNYYEAPLLNVNGIASPDLLQNPLYFSFTVSSAINPSFNKGAKMSSGVKANHSCLVAFEQLKMKRRASFIIFGFDSKNTAIEVLHEDVRKPDPYPHHHEHHDGLIYSSCRNHRKFEVCEFSATLNAIATATTNCPTMDYISLSNEHWSRMLGKLPDDDVRYAVSYVHYKIDNRQQTDIVFILWAPDSAPIKRKMLITSSASALKPSLVGIKATIQANCKSDLLLVNVIAEKLKGT